MSDASHLEGIPVVATDVRVDLDALPWRSPAPGLRFKAFEAGARRVRLMELSPGFEEADWCTRAHVVHVLEGTFTLRLRDRDVELRAGDVAVLAAVPRHAHKAVVGPAAPRVRLLLFEVADEG